ncbi:hypothetical protein DSO57_1011920 [Entomophthora muscae]|uniref:Uncharacterized protein n=1 Tax=Entomophthora muscae TaxID=34485 RepID=A0ACC2T689_9FUNG|nr:hypothetical protein DSO57_1011920 [Entomophthora muscae]
MKSIVFSVVFSVVSAYDSSGASWYDLSCAGWLNRECSSWMRCYFNGEYSRNNTKLACERADLTFNGNACWARKFYLTQRKHYDNCRDIAPNFCPRFYGKKAGGYKCLKE